MSLDNCVLTVRCNVLQCVAVWCSVLQCFTLWMQDRCASTIAHLLLCSLMARLSHMRELWYIWMSRVKYGWVMSHMNETCHTWMRHVTHVMHLDWCSFTIVFFHVTRVTREWVLSHTNESSHTWMKCFTYEWGMSARHIWMSRVTHVIYEWVVSHMRQASTMVLLRLRSLSLAHLAFSSTLAGISTGIGGLVVLCMCLWVRVLVHRGCIHMCVTVRCVCVVVVCVAACIAVRCSVCCSVCVLQCVLHVCCSRCRARLSAEERPREWGG